ncbi:MAG: multiheme c-type cytochrome [candidate division WOR-3 bacterium]
MRWLLAIFLIFVLSCSRKPPERYILFTGSLSGYLEACSCPGTPEGGLNASAYLAREFKKNHPDAILVDAGCFTYDTLDTLNAWFMARGMIAAGYDVVAIGSCDTPLAYSGLWGQLPVLGAERPYALKRRVLFVRVISEEMPEMRHAPAHDYTVLLSSAGREADETLAKRYSPDAIIEAKGEFQPFRVGKTLIVPCVPRGMSLGVLRLTHEGAEAWFVPVKPETPTHPDVDLVLEEYSNAYRSHIQRTAKKITYRGPGFCKFCHTEEYAAWKASEHSRGFETLLAEGKPDNPWCLTCHTTGFGKGGFIDPEKTPQLMGITCESCHPGGKCPDNPPPKGNLSDCRACHTSDQSPGFREEEYWQKIKH